MGKINKKIESYYKKKIKEISKVLNKNDDYILALDDKHDKLKVIHEKTKKVILTGKYNFYGIINDDTWIWASSIPGVNKKFIKKINELKQMSYLFENDNNPRILFYHQLLTQDMILLTDKEQINWINQLLIYLGNDIYFFNPTNTKGNLQFITLNQIIEKYI